MYTGLEQGEIGCTRRGFLTGTLGVVGMMLADGSGVVKFVDTISGSFAGGGVIAAVSADRSITSSRAALSANIAPLAESYDNVPISNISPDTNFITAKGLRSWEQINHELAVAGFEQNKLGKVAFALPEYRDLAKRYLLESLKSGTSPGVLFDDIISTEERLKYHIYNYDLPDLSLLFRKGVYQTSSVFKAIKDAGDRFESSPGGPPVRQLHFVLLDKPVLTINSLAELDPGLQSVFRPYWNELFQRERRPLGGAWFGRWEYRSSSSWDIKDKQTGQVMAGLAARHYSDLIVIALGNRSLIAPAKSFPKPGEQWLKHLLTHESYHRQNGMEPNNREAEINDAVFQAEARAYQDWVGTGDTSGYPWVFTGSWGTMVC